MHYALCITPVNIADIITINTRAFIRYIAIELQISKLLCEFKNTHCVCETIFVEHIVGFDIPLYN